MTSSGGGIAIAVTGLAARFPGAPSVTEFRALVRSGQSAVRRFSADELREAGVAPARSGHAQFVPAKGWIQDADCFDHAFFRMTPALARAMDPQHRIFLECCWHALEDAGLGRDSAQRRVGVFAGSSAASSYYHSYASLDPETAQALDPFQLYIVNQPAALPNQVSFYFDLTGPSVAVQTACSTGLATVVNACQSLIDFQCDAAIAGAATLSLPLVEGYFAPPGSILSPSGRCLPFDAQADGTVPGDGVAAVVLRRLDDAVRGGDRIYAAIRGYGITNDGARKVGFSAPSAHGQAAAITDAIAMAEVDPNEIGFIEGHGTATALGDAIEISALRDVFAASPPGTIALGAVKAQVGHLDVTAGLAGFIKAVIAIDEGMVPPVCGATDANPELERSPFRIPKCAEAWTARPRRAGVSSFGMGGTNVHVVIEEAPAEVAAAAIVHKTDVREADTRKPGWSAFALSAPSAAQLERMAEDLASFLVESAPDLADVATSLGRRRAFDHRIAVVAATPDQAALQLRRRSRYAVAKTSRVVFAFTGQGSQQVGLARSLYRASPSFAEALDACRADLRDLGCDVDPYLFESPSPALDDRISNTEVAQPTLFSFAYAYAAMLRAWGLAPSAMIGHSLGEYVALCLTGVLSRRDTLALVVARGRAIQAVGDGAMLAIAATPATVQPYLDQHCEIAAFNGPSRLVAAGPVAAIDPLNDRLTRDGIQTWRLASRRAFHSAMVVPSLATITGTAARLALHPPQIPLVSNLTGRLFATDRAPDPHYFAEQTRSPVCFSSGIATLIDSGHRMFLEIGAGSVLTSLVRANAGDAALTSIPVMPRPGSGDDVAQALEAVASAWTAGAELDWRAIDLTAQGRLISLPGFPFARTKCWVGMGVAATADCEPSPPPPRVDEALANDVTSVIRGAWAACLGHERIGADDDYHRLGGDSLTAVRIAEHLSAKLRVPVRPQDLVQAPTPARLAALIDQRGRGDLAAEGAVIEARKAASCDDPLVLFHAVGGSVHLYGELVAALPESQSVRLVQALPFAAQGPQPASVEAMARHYLAALDLPRGRQVHFAGASFGGLIAFEAAQQWGADASVIMLDSPAPGVIAAAMADEADTLAFMARLMGDPIAADALRKMNRQAQRQWIVDRLTGQLPDGRDGAGLDVFVDVFRANAQAMNSYRPALFDAASITLIAAATRDHGQPADPEEGWAPLTHGQMSVEIVPGGHLSMLAEPNVTTTARAIERAIARARGRVVRLARKAS